VKPGKYGWSIPCTYEKMTDNPFGLIQAAVFKVDDLADEIARLALSPADVAKKIQAVQERNKRYREIQHYRKWSEKFTRAVVPWMHTEN
jgi:protein-tyrosine phosphatase